MYSILLPLHSLFKWLVLLSLLYAVIRALSGYRSASFTKTDNAVRHWTATIAHIQLLLGIALYIHSPLIRNVFNSGHSITGQESPKSAIPFFAFFHSSMMFSAVVMVTVGSALAKRKESDRDKFRTQLIWFGLALLVILLAIPWPFSPLAQRPLIRTF